MNVNMPPSLDESAYERECRLWRQSDTDSTTNAPARKPEGTAFLPSIDIPDDMILNKSTSTRTSPTSVKIHENPEQLATDNVVDEKLV